MLKIFITVFWIFILFPAFSLEASPSTVRKVFKYIDTQYVEPVDMSLIYKKTLDQMKNNFPAEIKIETLGPENLRIVCHKQTMDFRISGLDQTANVRQMGNILQNCVPGETLTKLRKNHSDDEQIILDMLLGSLDPHSTFMNEEMYKELNTDMQGHFGGIGAEITVQNDVLTIVSPIDDTPAFMAGIKPGDQIIKINDVPTKGMTAWEAVKKIRGPENTSVRLSILRKPATRLKDFNITRSVINIKTVKYKLYDDHLGYIRLSSFQQNTASDLKAILREIAQKAGPLKGLLLDMRNNPGGLLDQAIKVSDEFLKSGVIVSTRGRSRFYQSRARARNSGEEPDYPVVILVNEGTASAAEIVTGALQDNRRALVLGTRTFGKGSVQAIFPLDDGSAIKLTTAKYYTPNGRVVHEEGITPDVPVGKSQGFREKDLNHIRTADPEDLADLRKKTKSRNSKDIEVENEAQLQAGLKLLRQAISAGDLQKGLRAFNAAVH